MAFVSPSFQAGSQDNEFSTFSVTQQFPSRVLKQHGSLDGSFG